MAGSADAAKSFLESAFNKTKEVVGNAAISTKGLADVALSNVTKLIPGQSGSAAPMNGNPVNPNGTQAPNGQPPQPPQ